MTASPLSVHRARPLSIPHIHSYRLSIARNAPGREARGARADPPGTLSSFLVPSPARAWRDPPPQAAAPAASAGSSPRRDRTPATPTPPHPSHPIVPAGGRERAHPHHPLLAVPHPFSPSPQRNRSSESPQEGTRSARARRRARGGGCCRAHNTSWRFATSGLALLRRSWFSRSRPRWGELVPVDPAPQQAAPSRARRRRATSTSIATDASSSSRARASAQNASAANPQDVRRTGVRRKVPEAGSGRRGGDREPRARHRARCRCVRSRARVGLGIKRPSPSRRTHLRGLRSPPQPEWLTPPIVPHIAIRSFVRSNPPPQNPHSRRGLPVDARDAHQIRRAQGKRRGSLAWEGIERLRDPRRVAIRNPRSGWKQASKHSSARDQRIPA